MHIEFDHCYQILSVDEFYELADRGFSLTERVIEHPGKVICRFIRFNHRQPSGEKVSQYLEFVEFSNLEQLISISGPNATEQTLSHPGFSLTANSDLHSVYASLGHSFAAFQPSYGHKNYNWIEDSTSRLPGWNFLNFDRELVPGIKIWCTEYEPRTIKVEAPPTHANSVEEFVGFIWNANTKQLHQVANLVQSEELDGKISLLDGTRIFAGSELAGFDKKETPFLAVVLKCKNWETFVSKAKPDRFMNWMGRRAGIIERNNLGWDIVVLEPDPYAE